MQVVNDSRTMVRVQAQPRTHVNENTRLMNHRGRGDIDMGNASDIVWLELRVFTKNSAMFGNRFASTMQPLRVFFDIQFYVSFSSSRRVATMNT